MYINGTLGVSEYTPMKQEHFACILRMHLGVTRAVLQKYPCFNQCYHFIDGAAGPGKYPHPNLSDQEIVGSPLIFLQEVDKTGVKYRADFIELNKSLYSALDARVNGHIGVTVHHGDYRRVIPEILGGSGQMGQNQYGLFYLDLSGEGTTLPDFTVVSYVAKARPKMEILIHMPQSLLKRVRSTYPDRWLTLKEDIDQSGKHYWFIRKLYPPLQWTFLMGSDTDIFRDYRKIGFYSLGSEQGMEIFREANLTRAEIQGELQPILDL